MNPQTVLLLAKLATDTIPAARKLIEKWQSEGAVSEMDALNALNDASIKHEETHSKFKERVNATRPTTRREPSPEPSVSSSESEE